MEILKQAGATGRTPFASFTLGTIQDAIRRLTVELRDTGNIRHAYSAHDFRHYFAIGLYQETRDVYAVMKTLGHGSVAMTQTYLAGSLGKVLLSSRRVSDVHR